MLNKLELVLILILAFVVLVGLAHCKEVTKVITQPDRIEEIHKKGHWLMSHSGHAVWCSGPNVVLGSLNGEFSYFGTQCVGVEGPTVKLHD